MIGDGHLAGILQLLKQDPQVRVLEEGVKLPLPDWDSDLQSGGRKWEKEALGGAALFVRLVEALDVSPLGSWMDVEALQELADMKAETLRRLREEGLEAQPAAPVSSQLGRELGSRNLLVTPKNEEELRCDPWLSARGVPLRCFDILFKNIH